MRALLLALLLLSPGLRAALSLPMTDAYGYTASQQAYAWTEISGTGTPVTGWAGGADDGSALINIPFNFRFYGAPYNKVAVSSNGYLQFGSQSSYYGVNCLGANLDPRNVAALYWMDLNPGAGGAVYSEVQGAPGSRVFIVQFQAVPRTVGGGSVTAQWRLYEADNSLEAAWASTGSSGSGADAVAGLRSGFDCPNRTSLPLSCQQADLSDSLSVRFQYPLSEPLCGTPTITPSFSISPTFSTSPTFSSSPTVTATYSDSPTATVTPTASPSFSASPSFTDSPTATTSFSASPSFSHSPTQAATATATPSASPTPSPSVTRTPLVLTDAFGYVAVQAPLAWQDISGTGSLITAWAGGADDGSALVDLPVGWLFRFYGADYTKVAVSSNGYLQFGSSSSAFGHSCLDAGASPFGLAALFWKDLDLDLGGDVRWQVLGSAPNRRLIIQFSGVPAQGGGPGLTAQAALDEGSHALSFRYLSSLGAGASASAGLRSFFECPNRTGLSLSCNAPGLPDGMQFDISYPVSEPACGTPTFTATPTSSATPTASPSPSSTATPSASPSPSATQSPSATVSPSATQSPTISPSWTISATFSVSPTFSASPTITRTYSASPTFSASPTVTQTGTISPSFTVSPTDTATPTVTETATISPTHSDSPTPTATPTETASFTISPTYSDSPTVTETATISPTFSVSPTATESFTASPTSTETPTLTVTPSATETATPTPTPTASPTATPSATRTASPTRTVSPTPTFTLFPPAAKPACLVLGQPSFTTNTASPGASGMNLPDGVALDTRVLPFRAYVADRNNHRVLIWNDASGLVNGSPADGVIGQADLNGFLPNQGGAVGPDTLREPSGLALDPLTGDLWVADTYNHRVLRFAAPIPLSGAAADRVLGQGGSFSSAVPSLGGIHAGSLNYPSGLSWSPLGQLAVADKGHHRALIFNNPGGPATADSAWGQGLSLNLGAANQGGLTGPGGLDSPEGVLLGSLELWIADTANNRVLRVGTWPTLTGTANLVLGQPDFTSNAVNQGYLLTNETRLHTPRGLGMDGGGRVLVADHGNHRVLGFEPPYENFADQWWGQSNIGTAIAGAGQDQLNQPGAVFAWAGVLAVADTANHRVLIYGCGAGIAAATPTPSRTITATHTPTFTHSPTVTPSFTVTQSHTRTETRTASETRTVSATVTETATRSATLTVTPTRTITRTFTPAATATVTLTLTQSLTPYPRTHSAIITWPNPAPLAGQRACIGFPPAADVRIELYDRLGQPVRSLDAGQIDKAGGFACWDLRNREGDAVAPGRYFVRVLLDGQVRMGRLTLR